MKILVRFLLKISLTLMIAGAVATTLLVFYAGSQLPEVETLQDIKLQVPLRIYSQDGLLMAEYGQKRRKPLKLEEVPPLLVSAVLSTEDRRFYDHVGVDFIGLLRAAVHVVTHREKGQGGSTITMQVARNFFLTRKKTYTRKFNEILLALKIEKELTKDQILELYLNKIYFGKRAYGIAAAAEVYFGKSVSDLSLDEMAILAGLPQAPSTNNPLNNPEAALKRRQHVLDRMLRYGYIQQEQHAKASAAPLTAQYHGRIVEMEAPYVAEMVRKHLIDFYGEDLYTSGFEIYTTVPSQFQVAAHDALTQGLHEYDERHGYRGALQNIPASKGKAEWLKAIRKDNTQISLFKGAVTAVSDEGASVLLGDNTTAKLTFAQMKWARKKVKGGMAATPKKPSDVVKVGDIIYLRKDASKNWRLAQHPEVEGAIVALNPHNGAIQAVVGGYDFDKSNFNRVNQALRQPGSNFKPIIYAAALLNGFTAASIINDAPIVIEDKSLDEGVWRPQNNERKFYGPTRLRVGLFKSINLITIRLLQAVGIPQAIQLATSFGFKEGNMPHGLSLALGTLDSNPLEMATGFSVFANGGYRIHPYLIHRIDGYDGKVIYEAHPERICPECRIDPQEQYPKDEKGLPLAKPVLPAEIAYIMTSMLQDVIRMGTGHEATSLNRQDLAGKTGTTNKKMDAWFTGYNPDIVASTWVGFDEKRSVEEYGSQAALPIWIKFMKVATKDRPDVPFPVPAGIVSTKIDPHSGLLARPDQTDAISEFFVKDTLPTQVAPVYVPPSPSEPGNESSTPQEAPSEDTLF